MQLHFDGCDVTSSEIGVFGDYKDVQWFCCLFQDTEGSGPALLGGWPTVQGTTCQYGRQHG